MAPCKRGLPFQIPRNSRHIGSIQADLGADRPLLRGVIIRLRGAAVRANAHPLGRWRLAATGRARTRRPALPAVGGYIQYLRATQSELRCGPSISTLYARTMAVFPI